MNRLPTRRNGTSGPRSSMPVRRRIQATFAGLTAAGALAAATLLDEQPIVFFASIADSTGATVATLTPGGMWLTENGAEGQIMVNRMPGARTR